MATNSGLQTAADGYTYYSTPKSVYVQLYVFNQAVSVSFGRTVGAGGPETASYPPVDEYVPPGSLVRPESFDAIRIKNATPGVVAQYSVSTRLSSDVPRGFPLGASFTPSYQVLNADGTITGVFSGGILLPAYTSSPGIGNAITWDNASGAMIARIAAGAAGSQLNLEGMASVNNQGSAVNISADNDGYGGAGPQLAEVSVIRAKDLGGLASGTGVFITTTDPANNTLLKKLLDSGGNSDWAFRSGNVQWDAKYLVNATTVNIAINSTVLVEVDIYDVSTITGLIFNITSAGAGSRIASGLYDSGGNRVALSATISVPPTGINSISFTSPVTVQPGTYYAALGVPGTATVATVVTGATLLGRSSTVAATFFPATIAAPTVRGSAAPSLATF